MSRLTLGASMLAAALAPAAFGAPNDNTADLSPGYTVGQIGSWTVTRTVADQSKALVAEGASKLSYTMEFTTEVRSGREDGGAVVSVTITRIAAEGEGDEGIGSFDSADPETDNQSNPDDFDRALHGLASRTFEVELDSFGTVFDVRGLSEFENRDPDASAIIERMLGVDALDRFIGPIVAIKPETPFTINVGDSYEDTCDSMLSVGRVLTRVELTLDGVKQSEAHLTLGGRTQLFGNTQNDVSPKVTSQKIEGVATWNTALHALNAYGVSIAWVVEAGGTQVPIRIERTETIAIAKKK